MVFARWWKKMIVVGIECSDRDLQRVQEYCPYSIESRIYGHIDGKGEETMNWIVNELKPFIDRTYRTWPFREATSIAGYSMGGMMSLYAVLHYNQYFSKAASISPSVLPAMESFKKGKERGYFLKAKDTPSFTNSEQGELVEVIGGKKNPTCN